MRSAVFLDRDDTILDTRGATAHQENPGDLTDPALVRLMSGAAAGLSRLQDAGLALVVYTSQGCVARGRATCAQVERVNARMRVLLRASAGVELSGVYYCPHHPEGHVEPFASGHAWRKPGPGMIVAAAGELGLEIGSSFAVGDMKRDAESALAAGIPASRVFLLGAGDQAEELGVQDAGTLEEAADGIVRIHKEPRVVHGHARSA